MKKNEWTLVEQNEFGIFLIPENSSSKTTWAYQRSCDLSLTFGAALAVTPFAFAFGDFPVVALCSTDTALLRATFGVLARQTTRARFVKRPFASLVRIAVLAGKRRGETETEGGKWRERGIGSGCEREIETERIFIRNTLWIENDNNRDLISDAGSWPMEALYSQG